MAPPVALAQTLAQSDEPSSRPLAELVRKVFGEGVAADTMELIIEPALQILVILIVAVVLSSLAHRFIRRTVGEMKDPDTHHRIGSLKRRVRLGEYAEGTHTANPRRIQRADALGALAESLTKVVIWVTAVFMIFGVFGVPLGPLVASAGIIGVALGFGAQDLVKDFLSGIFMLVEDQYGVGDVIDAGEATGVVEGVGLRSTRLRDVEGTLWHIPNGEIRRVGNMSQEWARTLLDVGVSYGTDTDEASAIILEVAQQMAAEDDYAPLFLDEPAVWGVQALGPDSVDIRLVIKTKPGDQWSIGRELRARIKRAFDAAGVEIPFPQRTIWLRTDAAGADAAPVIELEGAGAQASDGDGPAKKPANKPAKKATSKATKKAAKRSTTTRTRKGSS